MYLNAGGVTVSYFEWLKNLSHVRYGRMEKRFTENLNAHILGQMEELSGKKVSEKEREFIMHGPDEVDLVYSGLEETMITATHEIMNVWKSNPDIPDMRTAAYVVAINKVGNQLCGVGNIPITSSPNLLHKWRREESSFTKASEDKANCLFTDPISFC